MLEEGLVETLLNRGIINGATQLYAEFSKVDFSMRALKIKENFGVEKVEKSHGTHIFYLYRLENKEPVVLKTKDIILIDGMEPKDVAKAFDLNPNGTKNIYDQDGNLKKRRGRPRKHFPYGENK